MKKGRAAASLAAAAVTAVMSAGVAQAASLPYVADVEGWNHGKAIMVVECATDRVMRCRVTDCKTHKLIKVHQDDRALWYMTIRANRTYKIQTAPKSGKDRNRWKTIWYRFKH